MQKFHSLIIKSEIIAFLIYISLWKITSMYAFAFVGTCHVLIAHTNITQFKVIPGEAGFRTDFFQI